MKIRWCSGMRFKMAFEAEDSSRISWFMGTISDVHPADHMRWPGSLWRLLQNKPATMEEENTRAQSELWRTGARTNLRTWRRSFPLKLWRRAVEEGGREELGTGRGEHRAGEEKSRGRRRTKKFAADGL
ncbi:Auxin response factor 10 [Platanthera guangdongensis]|uniref:Auxin response factor 10 n=1 Tax=Platanthera guangdongensis TaxID=2320717 RepID=A0ABR2LQ51_9ASPA